MDRQRYEALINPAIALVIKKSQDYNNGGHDDVHTYFPFGMASYSQMIHVKSMRLVSLAKQEMRGADKPNFESVKDTLLDMINYCVFALDAIAKREQEPKKHPVVFADGYPLTGRMVGGTGGYPLTGQIVRGTDDDKF